MFVLLFVLGLIALAVVAWGVYVWLYERRHRQRIRDIEALYQPHYRHVEKGEEEKS